MWLRRPTQPAVVRMCVAGGCTHVTQQRTTEQRSAAATASINRKQGGGPVVARAPSRRAVRTGRRRSLLSHRRRARRRRHRRRRPPLTRDFRRVVVVHQRRRASRRRFRNANPGATNNRRYYCRAERAAGYATREPAEHWRWALSRRVWGDVRRVGAHSRRTNTTSHPPARFRPLMQQESHISSLRSPYYFENVL